MLKYEIMKGRNLRADNMTEEQNAKGQEGRRVTSLNTLAPCGSEIADGRSKTSPDSEQIEPSVAEQLWRNSASLEQFQDRGQGEGLKLLHNTLSRICKFAYCSLTNSTLSQRERVCRKAAFTLAEVLITLGIIGVVAAMTMPALITKYQKKVTSQKLKKFYTVMSQAIKLSEVENGPYPDWAPVTDGGNLPVEELITWYNTYLDKYIVSIDKRKPDSSHYQVAFKDGSGMNFYVNDHDKCIYIFYCTDYKHCDSESYNGRTTFLFKITVDPNGKHFGPSYRSELYTRERLLNDCKHPQTNNDDKRHACSGLLQYDGWEFKDDYPWNAEIN
ncbi:prepilin-type N-terminal cleavage/methylation domain-containing protein [bacterium]|nr:prepilin-type N-terminal cleavage/methylation domain-containing protein [bacterium]